MAPCPFPHLGVLLLLALAVSASASASAATDTPQQPAAASVPGSRFLHACCANTTNASACYDSLLPSAGSFHGNRVRVAIAATKVAFAQLRTFLDDLRRLQRDEGAGSGRDVEMALRSCVTTIDACVYREADALAALRRLETAAGRRRGEHAEYDKKTASIYVDAIGIDATTCIDDLGDRGDAAYATPVGKKMVAWATDVHLYGWIALELVASIKL